MAGQRLSPAPWARRTTQAPAGSPSGSAGPAGHSSRASHSPPDGLLITVPPLQRLLPAFNPRARAPAAPDTHPLCQCPAGQPKTTQGEIYWKGRGIKRCPCHTAKFPLTLQTFSLLISFSVETSSHCHTLVGLFHLGYKSAPSSMDFPRNSLANHQTVPLKARAIL